MHVMLRWNLWRLRSADKKIRQRLAVTQNTAAHLSARIAECRAGLDSPEPVGWFPMNDSPSGPPMYHSDYRSSLEQYSNELIKVSGEAAALETALQRNTKSLLELESKLRA